MTGKQRGRLGEEVERGFHKELKGCCPHQEPGSEGFKKRWEEELLQVCCNKTKNHLERLDEKAQGESASEQELEPLVSKVEVWGEV